MTYFCTECRIWNDGCGRKSDEDLCAADDRCNGFRLTKQSVRRNDRVVDGEIEVRIWAIVACLGKTQSSVR